MAPAIAPDAKIPCPTPQHLQAELETLTYALEPEEKEDTWEKFEKAIIRFAAVTRGGGYKHLEMYIEGVGRKGVGPKLAKCMLSDRGRLSGVSTDLLQTFAPRLSSNFKPLVNLFLEPLIDLLGRPNKVFLKRAEKCFITIITHCHLFGILPEMKRGLSDNAASCRRGCAIGIERAMKEWGKEIFGKKGAKMLEDCVKKMATDKDPEVRQTGRRVWAKFQEIWAERIDDFSAPLTPTIRRYLEIPAANGPGPSKLRAATRPAAAPSSRPASTATTSSLGATVTKPQYSRVQALNSRPHRPAAPPTRPAPTEAGPSRRQSPRKESGPVEDHEVDEEEGTHAVQPMLSRSVSSGPSRPFDMGALGTLGRNGRSVSHNILTSIHVSGGMIDLETGKYNPLSKPVRPALTNVLSTMSLPADPSEMTQPPRRFAPPARIVRLIQPSDEDGANDPPYGEYPIVTPSGTTVLRGAVRAAHAGISRRPPPLGQAHRRVVTAPVGPIAEDDTTMKTPVAAGRTMPRQRPAEQEKESRVDVEDQIAKERQPISSETEAEHKSQYPVPLQSVHVDSPLMPVLIRSASGDVKADDKEEQSDGMIDMENEVYPASPAREVESEESEKSRKELEIAAKVELPSSPVHEAVALTDQPEDGNSAKKLEQPSAEFQGEERDTELETAGPLSAPLKKLEDVPTDKPRPVVDTLLGIPSETADLVSSAQSSTTTTGVDLASTTSEEVPSAPDIPNAPDIPPKPAQSRPKVVTAKSTLATTKPSTTRQPPAARKPPVPPARTARTVSAPISRRPFKPTSLTTATAASAARAVSVSNPAPAPSVISKPAVATSTTAKVPIIVTSTKSKAAESASTSVKPVATVSAKTATSPAKATKSESKPAVKAAIPPVSRPGPARVVSGARKPTVSSQVPLPPAKKEKIRLKAPLPSFRPQSNKTRAAADTAAQRSLQASTSSAPGGRARVRPEMIKLPESPAQVKPSEVPLPASPRDIPLPPTPHSMVSSVANSAQRPSPLKTERSRARAASTASAPQSPITVAPPKPLSPILTTETSHLPPAPNFAPAQLVSGDKYLNGMGLPSSASDPFASTSARTNFSEASTQPAMSEASDETSDTTDGEMDGVTFNHPSETRTPVQAEYVAIQEPNGNGDLIELSASSRQTNAFAPRMDVSTPQKSAAMLLAKLDGVSATLGMTGTERKVLSVKDANTPGWMDADMSA
ncbi:hypothetical protein IAR55_003682 [Kwoniella newhampshirensis]|uniref:CLASP N-terminal domain-containing protein n=1 Tax=Kwoniella newhampshirensis TaxID=1651941 RepID=A0AAW0Z1E2_9TREE